MAARSLSGSAGGPRPLGGTTAWASVALAMGALLCLLGIAMIPSLIADLVAGHPDYRVFLLSAGASLFVGITLVLMNRHAVPRQFSPREVFLLTTVAWLGSALFAALPLYLSEFGLTPAEAFFEAMSGLTTTGSTVLQGLDGAPPGLLLWRALLQWLGGIGIIVMGVAILPMLSVGGMQLFRSESSDLSDKVLPRTAQLAGAIGGVYLALTLVLVLLYWWAGMGLFDAVAHALTTIATGGFSTRDASLAAFQSPAVEWIAILFMTLGGIPFVLYVQALRGRPLPLWQDSQVRWYLAILAVSAGLLWLWLVTQQPQEGLSALRLSLFTTVALVTGTGYAVADYGSWGTFAVALLFFLMCVGGCTGSTTGGIKVFRFVILYQVSRVQIARLLQPNGVFRPHFNGRPVPEAVAISVLAFVFLFALSFSVLAVALSFFGLDFLTAMSAALTALANVGPGLGAIVGPTGTFAPLPEGAKWLLAFGMLLGRLELFTVLVLLTPMYWRA